MRQLKTGCLGCVWLLRQSACFTTTHVINIQRFFLSIFKYFTIIRAYFWLYRPRTGDAEPMSQVSRCAGFLSCGGGAPQCRRSSPWTARRRSEDCPPAGAARTGSRSRSRSRNSAAPSAPSRWRAWHRTAISPWSRMRTTGEVVRGQTRLPGCLEAVSLEERFMDFPNPSDYRRQTKKQNVMKRKQLVPKIWSKFSYFLWSGQRMQPGHISSLWLVLFGRSWRRIYALLFPIKKSYMYSTSKTP